MEKSYKTVQLYFEEFGEGVPVILLHGFPLDHTIWSPLVPLLKDEMRLILPDLRGHGQSPVPEGVYTMRLMAEDVMALMDSLKIKKAILVGHSMGGYVGLSFAHAYPDRVSGLGLITTQSFADNPERRQWRLNVAEDIEHRGVHIFAEGMAANLSKQPELEKILRDLIRKMNPKGVVGAIRGMAERPDATEWLAGIQIPALVLAGSADAISPLEKSETMAQLLPKAWLTVVEGAGHMPMLEYPQEVAKALKQLVRSVRSSQ